MRAVVLYCILFAGCAPDARLLDVQPPVRRAEFLSDDEVVVTLMPGFSARAVAGRDLFGEFEPPLNSSLARERFGEPTETVHSGAETLYVYVRGKSRVGIRETPGTTSASGPAPRASSLIAWPYDGYVLDLPPAIQALIGRRRGNHSLIVSSTERSDWNVDIFIRDGVVQYVVARDRTDFTS